MRAEPFSVGYFVVAILAVVFLQDFFVSSRHTEALAYSEFKSLLAAGKVSEIAITDTAISGRIAASGLDGVLPPDRVAALGKLSGTEHFFTTVKVDDPGLVAGLDAAKVRYAGKIESRLFATLLSWVVPALVFFGVWAFFMKRMGAQSGLLEIGKSRAKVYMEKQTGVNFADVAGIDEAKAELMEVVDFLRTPERYRRLGGRIPKGVMLVGAPGTGKTLLAKAVAGEAGVPFLSLSGSEFVEMFVGVGAARVRDLFKQAEERAPCIIFIDELDAMGRARGMGPMAGGHDEKEQTLNQLLSELDGFDPSQGVVLLAATNRPEILDAALLRAGRFDRQILVDRPDKKARVEILQLHLRKLNLAPDAKPELIAALTPGFTGADLANLVNEAAILATRNDATHVGMGDFNLAIERIVAGLEKKNRLLNPHERKVTAYHEMGHALVARAIPGTDPVHKVSIIPRGIGALGYTIQRPTEDRFLMSSGELKDKMTVLLGGRAAESIVFEEISTGAADDLAKATGIARSMVTRYGMNEELGMVSLESERSTFLQMPGEYTGTRRDFSEQTAREVDCAVRDLVTQAFERAVSILEEHREALAESAERLLEKETLSGDELPKLVAESGRPIPADR